MCSDPRDIIRWQKSWASFLERQQGETALQKEELSLPRVTFTSSLKDPLGVALPPPCKKAVAEAWNEDWLMRTLRRLLPDPGGNRDSQPLLVSSDAYLPLADISKWVVWFQFSNQTVARFVPDLATHVVELEVLKQEKWKQGPGSEAMFALLLEQARVISSLTLAALTKRWLSLGGQAGLEFVPSEGDFKKIVHFFGEAENGASLWLANGTFEAVALSVLTSSMTRMRLVSVLPWESRGILTCPPLAKCCTDLKPLLPETGSLLIADEEAVARERGAVLQKLFSELKHPNRIWTRRAKTTYELACFVMRTFEAVVPEAIRTWLKTNRLSVTYCGSEITRVDAKKAYSLVRVTHLESRSSGFQEVGYVSSDPRKGGTWGEALASGKTVFVAEDPWSKEGSISDDELAIQVDQNERANERLDDYINKRVQDALGERRWPAKRWRRIFD